MLKNDNGFLLVFNSNFVSIRHRFRDNDFFLQTGNDVIVISLLGAPYILFDDGFWKDDPKFLVMLYWHILPIFNRIQVIRPFHFGWDFPTAGEIYGVFGESDPQNVNILKNTCLGGTALRQTTSFELSCMDIDSLVWVGRVARNNKTKKKKHTKARDPYIPPPHGTAPLMRS